MKINLDNVSIDKLLDARDSDTASEELLAAVERELRLRAEAEWTCNWKKD